MGGATGEESNVILHLLLRCHAWLLQPSLFWLHLPKIPRMVPCCDTSTRAQGLLCAFEKKLVGHGRGRETEKVRLGMPAYLPLLEAIGVVQKVRDVRPSDRLCTQARRVRTQKPERDTRQGRGKRLARGGLGGDSSCRCCGWGAAAQIFPGSSASASMYCSLHRRTTRFSALTTARDYYTRHSKRYGLKIQVRVSH